jgi:hypothetical protein
MDHSPILDTSPSANSRKSKTVNWLKIKAVTIDPTDSRAELLQRVQPLKTSRKIYELDQIANEQGHHFTRLPPYHCQYNTTELTWPQAKREVSDKNKTFKVFRCPSTCE